MKINRSKLLKLAATGASGVAMAHAVQGATILTGDSQANNDAVMSNHGSNAPGTPNIAVTWSPVDANGWQSYTDGGWTNPSPIVDTGTGLYQMDNAIDGASYTIQLAPDAGFNAILSSIDFNVYNNGGAFNIDWSVTGSSSGLLDSDTFVAPTDANTTLSFGDLTGTGSESLLLTLNIGAGSGIGSYLAADNIAFDQVPEPSTALLGLTTLGTLAMRRRRA